MSETPAGSTRWSLIHDAAQGDGPARSRFARTYLPLVRAFFASRWGGAKQAADIDDAIQETFVECFRERGTLARADGTIGDFRAYLFGIVRHIAKRFETRGGALPVAGAVLAENLEAREQNLSRAFDSAWAQTMMRLAGELMEARADAAGAAARLRVELLRLRFEKELPIREIAAQWGMDPEAVHRSYARARAEFHSCLRAVVREHAVRTEDDLDAECRRILALLR